VSVELKNAEGLYPPRGYSHMSIAQGSKVVHFAGQIGMTADGMLMEGLAEQVEQAHINLATALEASGAKPSDLVKITWYVKNWSDAVAKSFGEGLRRGGQKKPFPQVPMTIVGVQSLYRANIDVEVEAVAVIA
jgi:enamine deaminase RidA (YjgF/YER057c/UK114 family)